jgi:hypothetical protein
MGARTVLALLVGGIALAGGVLWAWLAADGPYADQIRQLERADINAEVEAAVSNGDFRFVGVAADGIIVPGLPTDRRWPLRSELRVIENTSDVIRSREHGRLQWVASAYAEEYNRALLAKLAKR